MIDFWPLLALLVPLLHRCFHPLHILWTARVLLRLRVPDAQGKQWAIEQANRHRRPDNPDIGPECP